MKHLVKAYAHEADAREKARQIRHRGMRVKVEKLPRYGKLPIRWAVYAWLER